MTLQRSRRNPILTRADLPDIPPHVVDATSVFNPGAVKFGDRCLLMVRVQTRGRETFLMMADSTDGEQFEFSRQIVRFRGIDEVSETVYHVYDPRITDIDGSFFVTFAVDTDAGCRLGVSRTEDFSRFEFLGLGRGTQADRDIRNGVLFPERFDGRFLRLDRPNRRMGAREPTTGDTIRLSESRDLVTWAPLGTVMSGRPFYWDELIGPGPPPVKTRDGWLVVYHGIATHGAARIYQAGAVLLDLDDPTRVRARTRNNILEPRESYEMIGQVPNVVFPTGMIVEQYDKAGFAVPASAVRLFYGAADTSVALATTTIEELVAACHE